MCGEFCFLTVPADFHSSSVRRTSRQEGRRRLEARKEGGDVKVREGYLRDRRGVFGVASVMPPDLLSNRAIRGLNPVKISLLFFPLFVSARNVTRLHSSILGGQQEAGLHASHTNPSGPGEENRGVQLSRDPLLCTSSCFAVVVIAAQRFVGHPVVPKSSHTQRRWPTAKPWNAPTAHTHNMDESANGKAAHMPRARVVPFDEENGESSAAAAPAAATPSNLQQAKGTEEESFRKRQDGGYGSLVQLQYYPRCGHNTKPIKTNRRHVRQQRLAALVPPRVQTRGLTADLISRLGAPKPANCNCRPGNLAVHVSPRQKFIVCRGSCMYGDKGTVCSGSIVLGGTCKDGWMLRRLRCPPVHRSTVPDRPDSDRFSFCAVVPCRRSQHIKCKSALALSIHT